MSDNKESLNLSEILFKPKRSYLETSQISNSNIETSEYPQIETEFQSYLQNWYRPINRFFWTWLGGNLLDIDEALANIATSKNKRTNDKFLDTVIDYGPGNWIYEFANIAQRRFLLGKDAVEKGDKEQAAHQFRMASRYFAIAAYPNLKGDALAQEAMLLGLKSYRCIFENMDSGYFSEETFKVNDKDVTGYLHAPDNKNLHPCIIIAGTYSLTAIDYFRMYNDYLAKHGIAVLILDMPNMGGSSQISLDINCNAIIDNAIEHIKKIPFIDSTNIGLSGHGIGAIPVIKSLILNNKNIKAAVVVSPYVHSFYTNQDFLNLIPLCQRASIANRLNLDAANWSTIIPQLQMLSLKKQGLLGVNGRIKTPIFISRLEDNEYVKEDVDLISNNFENSVVKTYKNLVYTQHKFKLFLDIEEFFVKNFGI